MRANRILKNPINPQLGEFIADALPERRREFELRWEEVDVEIETAADGGFERGWEGGVGGGEGGCGGVDEGFPVGGDAAGEEVVRDEVEEGVGLLRWERRGVLVSLERVGVVWSFIGSGESHGDYGDEERAADDAGDAGLMVFGSYM